MAIAFQFSVPNIKHSFSKLSAHFFEAPIFRDGSHNKFRANFHRKSRAISHELFSRVDMLRAVLNNLFAGLSPCVFLRSQLSWANDDRSTSRNAFRKTAQPGRRRRWRRHRLQTHVQEFFLAAAGRLHAQPLPQRLSKRLPRFHRPGLALLSFPVAALT